MIVSVPSCGLGRGAGHRRVDQRQPALARARRRSRGSRSGRSSSSRRTACPARRRRRRRPRPSSTCSTWAPSTTIVITIVGSRGRRGGRGGDAWRRARRRTPRRVARGAVPDRQLEAGAGQVGGHPRAHDPEAEEGDALAHRADHPRRVGVGRSMPPPPGVSIRSRWPGCELADRLGRQLLAVEQVAARLRPCSPPSAPGRRVAAALGDQRVAQRRQRLELADHAVAAAVRARRRPSRGAASTRPSAAGTRARAPRPAC